MANKFQEWLITKGYYRSEDDLCWMKDYNEEVNGKELFERLKEFRLLNTEE